LVVLQAKYEQLLHKTPTSCTPAEEVEVNKFITNMLENIKELHTKEVKHCDSLICELELICELDLEYIMCPTDSNFYKGMRAQKEWNRKHRDISAGAINSYEDQHKNFKKLDI